MIINTARNQKLLVVSIFLLLGLLHLSIVVLNHYNFKTFAYDYGVYNFAFFDFAHFRISPVPVYITTTDITFLQDHFSLSLLILSPLYWVLSPLFATYTLLLVQWALILLGAWATFKYIMLKTQSTYISLAAMVFYFILYSRFSSYANDCNLAIMGSALVPVFLLYFEKRNYFLGSLCFLLLILNREDFALNLFFLCALLFIIHRKDKTKRNYAALLAVSAILVFFIIFKYIIPLLESEHKKFSLFNYGALGKGPYEAFLFILSHPLDSMSLLFKNHSSDPGNDWVKFKFYIVYFISGGFLLLYRPLYLIALFPLIAKKMYNDDSFRWSYESYYSVELASILPILVFSVISEISSPLKKKLLSFTVIILTTGITIYCLENSTAYYYGVNKFNFLSDSFNAPSVNVKKVNVLLAQIPDEASVCASGSIVSHLAFREKIYYFPNINDAEYVCLSSQDVPYPLPQADFDERIKQLKENAEFSLIDKADHYFLYKRIP